MRLKSIRARMTLAFAFTILLLMLLACSALIWYAQRADEYKANDLLTATLGKVKSDLADNAPHIDPTDLRDDVKSSKMALAIFDPGGRILFQSQPRIPSRPWKSNAEWVVKATPFQSNTVVLALPWSETQQALNRQAALLMLLGLFITVAATVGAWAVVGSTLSPIGALSRQARTASAENLHLRLNPSSQDAEIVELVSTLNGLLARISETVAAKGRFHAAASHELRTPLQVLSGQLELALHRDRSNQEYRRCIEEAGVYAKRLTALTRDLLLLHQLDAAQPVVKTEVNLPDLCERALTWLEPKIRERDLQVRTGLPHDAMLQAPASHAEMLIRNLLENAVNYAPPSGCVRVDLGVIEGRLQFTVWNDFPGLPEGDLQGWLEPFHHREAAPRSVGEGTGLGLAICAAIVAANGWTMKLNSSKGGVFACVLFGAPL